MEHLCMCTKCGKVMYDENPQIDAPKENSSFYSEIDNMVFIYEDGGFWACGDCETDDYIVDLPLK